MEDLERSLVLAISRLQNLKYNRDKAIAAADAIELVHALVKMKAHEQKVLSSTSTLPHVVKLLGSLAKSKLFLGRKYHVSKHKEFEEAIDALYTLLPVDEQITL